MTTPEAEIYHPRKWTLPAAGFSAVFALACLELAAGHLDGHSKITVGASALLMGLLAAFCVRQVLTAGTDFLKVSREGIAYKSGKIASSFDWSVIQEFRDVLINKNFCVVGIVFNDRASLSTEEQGDARVAKKLTQDRFDGILLPDDYGWKTPALAKHLNDMKEKYAR